MTTYTTNDFSEIVLDRKPIRVYDETHKVPHEEMLTMTREVTTAPPSVNMQLWCFVVAESEAGEEKLKPLIRFDTRQNETSSAMFLIFGDLNCHGRGEEIHNQTYASGKMLKEVRDQQLAAITPHYESLSRE